VPCIAEIASKGSVAMHIETLSSIGSAEIEGQLIEALSEDLHWSRSGADRPAQRELFLLKQHGMHGKELLDRLVAQWDKNTIEESSLKRG
jgi:hypothetical protein